MFIGHLCGFKLQSCFVQLISELFKYNLIFQYDFIVIFKMICEYIAFEEQILLECFALAQNIMPYMSKGYT